ncbi:hypothetical protein A2U01_0057834, partial [Trifolium medium]|nr:hypothetical protein [Trifolium medium]
MARAAAIDNSAPDNVVAKSLGYFYVDRRQLLKKCIMVSALK